jgi:N-acetylmuramoyl-L-alanine amidase
VTGRWAKAVLVLAMVAWTALTALAGWHAFRGGPGASAEASAYVVYDVASPAQRRSTTVITPQQAADVLPRAPDPARAQPRATGSLQPVPKYAAPAGADLRVRSVDPEGAPRRPSAPVGSSKGVVVLDPGHGRGDPGAVHYYDDGSGRYYTEAESNLRNAELIRDELLAMGYEVYLTREGAGVGPGAPLPLQFITSDLFARVALARAVGADVYLALHGNGARVPSISGPETWYCGRHREGAANERFATLVQQAMVDALREYGYAPPDRGIKEDARTHHSGDFCQFVVTRETPVPAALLEFLFLSNADDARVLIDDRSHVLMAKHVAHAIDVFMAERRPSR